LIVLALPAASVPPASVTQDQPQRWYAPAGQQHRRDRGDQEQLDDAGLGQRN